MVCLGTAQFEQIGSKSRQWMACNYMRLSQPQYPQYVLKIEEICAHNFESMSITVKLLLRKLHLLMRSSSFLYDSCNILLFSNKKFTIHGLKAVLLKQQPRCTFIPISAEFTRYPHVITIELTQFWLLGFWSRRNMFRLHIRFRLMVMAFVKSRSNKRRQWFYNSRCLVRELHARWAGKVWCIRYSNAFA